MSNYWKCGRDLGPMLERQKMMAEKRPIRYASLNAIRKEAYQAEQASRAAPFEQVMPQ